MNGEMYQIASIVAAAKKAMQLSEPIRYAPVKYEGRIEFAFLPRTDVANAETYTAPDVSAWFEQIKKIGVQDIKLLCPLSTKDRQTAGFSNTGSRCILCFHKDGKVTFFVADWQFDSDQKQWNILYSEHAWATPPREKPHFEDHTDSFRDALLAIKELATKIKCDHFARIFDSALKLLGGNDEYPDKKFGMELPPIPRKNLQLFEAASVSDVFGAMGSWNDDPAGMAYDNGLTKEYEKLSDELLKNIRLAILYAINEW